jgi:hypothetical protein
MKRTFNSVLVTGLLLALTSAARAQTPANLAYLDDGGGNPIAPTPGPDDQSQLTTGGVSNPPGFNYYVNNNPAPGQTFTTGSNPGGYILNSLSVFEPGNSGGQPNGGQAYLLRIYTVSGSSATLYASYISPNNVFLYDTYWYQWTNLNNLTLLPIPSTLTLSLKRRAIRAGQILETCPATCIPPAKPPRFRLAAAR